MRGLALAGLAQAALCVGDGQVLGRVVGHSLAEGGLDAGVMQALEAADVPRAAEALGYFVDRLAGAAQRWLGRGAHQVGVGDDELVQCLAR